ncbi:hypothetical protein K788_0006193 (plasmid) [Paraburkholderia caribensis MBA4]|uniref:Uncharacterized protein n=1 Tax=Paraburkholderia caribensis MBA4 TaxID=1323664 RepID=A0A0P0RLH1_9BURK|nr:hypothetical protein K788_0006193 [Paraburkholderia caribensis MBA4]
MRIYRGCRDLFPTASVNRAPCIEIGIDCAIGTDNLESADEANTLTGQQQFALIEQ